MREHHLSDDLYGRAEAEFGRAGLVEIIVLAGYYGLIGYALNGVRGGPAGGREAAVLA